MVEHTASQGDRDPDPERKEEENKRVGDDPGEVVWALTYSGAATMTKTDFALVLTLFWPTYRLNKHCEGSCELLSLNLILMLTSC